jgi:hypothetical protein
MRSAASGPARHARAACPIRSPSAQNASLSGPSRRPGTGYVAGVLFRFQATNWICRGCVVLVLVPGQELDSVARVLFGMSWYMS